MFDQIDITALHDRDNVRQLHQAHADHIESSYRGEMERTHEPGRIAIRRFGETRTFIAPGRRLENRAILTGNETPEQLDELFAYYDSYGSNCFIEVNPANFYRTEPFSWACEVVPLLLERGCRLEGMRCVWARELPTPEAIETPLSPVTEVYGLDQAEVFDDLASAIDSKRHVDRAERRPSNQGEDWLHVIGFEGDMPASCGELFVTGEIGYLAYWYTGESYRRRGHHRAGIYRRMVEAAARGCTRVFSVSDFNNASSRHLQACGFRLAYNYLMLQRPAKV